MRAIGDSFNVSEDAAKMRVKRVVARLGRFKTRVEAILTPEQRKLVGTTNGIYEESLTAAQDEYRGQLEHVVKTDKARQEELRREVQQKAVKNFRARFKGNLSKEQWAGFTKAAEAEELVAKNSVKVKKD